MIGDEVAAQAIIEMIKETFARFDERMDPERFLPGGLLQPGVPPPYGAQVAAAAGMAPAPCLPRRSPPPRGRQGPLRADWAGG